MSQLMATRDLGNEIRIAYSSHYSIFFQYIRYTCPCEFVPRAIAKEWILFTDIRINVIADHVFGQDINDMFT
jgi:hypothetical protein